jgi:hypothetical protein
VYCEPKSKMTICSFMVKNGGEYSFAGRDFASEI